MVNTGKQMLRRAISKNEVTNEGEIAEETFRISQKPSHLEGSYYRGY
jgi:hypothetical protein